MLPSLCGDSWYLGNLTKGVFRNRNGGASQDLSKLSVIPIELLLILCHQRHDFSAQNAP